MINQISNANNIQNKQFANFTQPKGGYYLPASYLEESNKEKSRKFGKTLVVSALVVGFGTLGILSGGANKGVAKVLKKWKGYLEKKLAKGSKFEDLYRFSLNKIDNFMSKTESVNNFTSLKDVLFQKFMWGKNGSRKFTRRIHERITEFFDRVSRKTVNSSYNSTQEKFSNLTEYFSSLNSRILNENSSNSRIRNALIEIDARMTRVNKNLEDGFGVNARNKRYKEIQNATDGLFDFFWDASFSDIKNFRSKNMWQSFIAEDYLIPAKLKMSNDVALLRQMITHDINDNYVATMKALDNVQKFINPSDTLTNDVLRNIRSKLDRYKKLSGNDEVNLRSKLNREIIDELKNLSLNFKNSSSKYHYTDAAVKSIANYVQDVENIISKSSKGELQEILSLYKSILPRSQYLKLKSKVNSAIRSLDKSIDTETNKYYDKARDLKLGSAPTDVISILFTMGTVGYYLNKSKGKDEKISSTLKYGIPAVGAIVTSLYTAARMVAGSKALIFGLVSAWALNKAGVLVDDFRKKYSLDISFQNKALLKSQSDKV